MCPLQPGTLDWSPPPSLYATVWLRQYHWRGFLFFDLSGVGLAGGTSRKHLISHYGKFLGQMNLWFEPSGPLLGSFRMNFNPALVLHGGGSGGGGVIYKEYMSELKIGFPLFKGCIKLSSFPCMSLVDAGLGTVLLSFSVCNSELLLPLRLMGSEQFLL